MTPAICNNDSGGQDCRANPSLRSNHLATTLRSKFAPYVWEVISIRPTSMGCFVLSHSPDTWYARLVAGIPVEVPFTSRECL